MWYWCPSSRRTVLDTRPNTDAIVRSEWSWASRRLKVSFFGPHMSPQVAFIWRWNGTSRLAPVMLIDETFGHGFAKNVRDLYTE